MQKTKTAEDYAVCYHYIEANPTAYIDCMQCNRKCPMNFDVNAMMKTGGMSSADCI